VFIGKIEIDFSAPHPAFQLLNLVAIQYAVDQEFTYNFRASDPDMLTPVSSPLVLITQHSCALMHQAISRRTTLPSASYFDGVSLLTQSLPVSALRGS